MFSLLMSVGGPMGALLCAGCRSQVPMAVLPKSCPNANHSSIDAFR